MHSCRLALIVLLLLPLHVDAQATPPAGSVQGRVLDAATGEPVPAVRVDLLDPGGRALTWAVTDAEGRFRFEGVRSETISLRAERIGYRTTTSSPERIVGGETVVLTLRMPPDVLVLAPFEVEGTARVRRAEIAGFEERRARGVGGHFLSREEIRARPANRISDLLAGIPGLRVSEGSADGRSGRLVSLAWSPPGVAGGRCPVQLFVNGVPASNRLAIRGFDQMAPLDGVRVDHLAHPSTLEGLEVYTDLASVPPEYLTPDAGCGVIAIWTGRDDRIP